MTEKRRKRRDCWYRIYNRGVEKRDIFIDERDYQYFLMQLEMTTKRYGIEFHSYCLMKNHYHLLAYTPNNIISEAMHRLLTYYVSYFNHRHDRDGPLFKSRFQSKQVNHEAYLVKLVSYIHINPIKDSFVSQLCDYPWSSYHAFVNPSAHQFPCETRVIWQHIHELGYIDNFEQFVLDHHTDLSLIHQHMGSMHDINQLTQQHYEIRLMDVISEQLVCDLNELFQQRKGLMMKKRKVALYCFVACEQFSTAYILKRFNLKHISSIKRITRDIHQDKTPIAMANRILNKVYQSDLPTDHSFEPPF